ncbi:MAG: gliding motility lipoprotein GldH [Tenuifilaceae bacterium]
MLRFKIIIIIISLFLAASCDRNGVFEKNIDTENNIWNIADIAKFEVTIADTISYQNIFINIRNTTDYPNSNLYLFIKTVAPSGASQLDTLEYFVSDEYGKWLGKGFGQLRDNRFPYKQNIRFSSKGNYQFEVQQAMRTDQLKGIASIGLRIEKSLTKK